MERQAIARGLTLITGPTLSGKTTLARALKAQRALPLEEILEDDAPCPLTGQAIRAALKKGPVTVTSLREDILKRVGFKKRPERHIRIDIASGIAE